MPGVHLKYENMCQGKNILKIHPIEMAMFKKNYHSIHYYYRQTFPKTLHFETLIDFSRRIIKHATTRKDARFTKQTI